MKDADQSLLLLTNHFPFGNAESFIENELPHLASGFKKVHILAKDVDSHPQRAVPSNVSVTRINPKSSVVEYIIGCWLILTRVGKIISIVSSELSYIRKNDLPTPAKSKRTMFHDLFKGVIYSYHIDKAIRGQHLANVIVYSYWLGSFAVGSILSTKKNIRRRISRGHGGDVYEQRNAQRYLSFRTLLLEGLDRVFTISEDARRHLLLKTQESFANKITVSRLGTREPTRLPPSGDSMFVLVSCSFMLPVKRINIIVEALALINDLQITWYHIGDGQLQPEITSLAAEKLSSKQNIFYRFPGSMTNTQLFEFYETHFSHLFINVSSSEGVPVTIMEAQSFGIPAIGPAVGGVPEIIVPGTGLLIKPDAGALDVAKAIKTILTLPTAEYNEMRMKARQNWKARYNADENLSSFVTAIKEL